MRRPSWVLIGFAALVIAEIWLLGYVATRVGPWWLLGLLVAGAALGGLLVRHEGVKAWRSLRQVRDEPGRLGERITDAALVLVGGILLVLPGFVTDAVGLLCLLPFTRPLARRTVGAVLATVARPYRDQADLLRARLERDTVVPGETVAAPGERHEPRPGDPTIIRGELEP